MNKIYLALLTVLVIPILMQCQKDPQPVVEKVTITAEALNGAKIDPSGTKVYDSGITVLYNISFEAGFEPKTILIDGVKQPLNVLTLKINTSNDKNISVEGISSGFLLISKGADDKTMPYHLKNISYFNDKNQFLDSLILVKNPDRLTNQDFFYSNGKYESLSKDLKTVIGGGYWSYDGKTFLKDSKIHIIIENSLKKFVFDCPPFVDIVDGVLTHQRVTLVRK